MATAIIKNVLKTIRLSISNNFWSIVGSDRNEDSELSSSTLFFCLEKLVSNEGSLKDFWLFFTTGFLGEFGTCLPGKEDSEACRLDWGVEGLVPKESKLFPAGDFDSVAFVDIYALQ